MSSCSGGGVGGFPPKREERFDPLQLVFLTPCFSPQSRLVMCRTLSPGVSCDIPMPLVQGCRDWARERLQRHVHPDPEGEEGTQRGSRAPAPTHLCQSRKLRGTAHTVPPPPPCHLPPLPGAVGAVLLDGKDQVKKSCKEKTTHTILKQTGSCDGLFGQRDSCSVRLLPWVPMNCVH